MRRRLAVVAAIAAAVVGGSAVAPSTELASLAPPAYAKTCSSRYVHGVIGGEHKCLGVGQFCARRHEPQYHRYGFHCHRYDASVMRYRLTR